MPERVVGIWYRSLTPDGKVWCESSDPDEVMQQSVGMRCVFQRLEVVQTTRPWREWTPDAPR